MRFLIILIIIALALFKFWPEQPVPTAEERALSALKSSR